jgi:hypothetical protein
MKIRNLLLVFIVAFGLVYCGSENNVTEIHRKWQR